MTQQDPPVPSRPGPVEPAPADRSGGTALKVVVVLVVLVAVVFVVTFFTQYAPREEKPKPPPREAAVRFFTSTRQREPNYANPDKTSPDIFFPGYFEPEVVAKASFWFENPVRYRLTAASFDALRKEHVPEDVLAALAPLHDKTAEARDVAAALPWPEAGRLRQVLNAAEPQTAAAVLQPNQISCGTCSEGALAVVPPDAARNVQQMFAVSLLPQGPLTGTVLPTGMAGPGADLLRRLEWETHAFKTTDWAFHVPAPPANDDGWTPLWGVLNLQFTPGSKSHMGARFVVLAEGAKEGVEQKFEINFASVPPFAAMVEQSPGVPGKSARIDVPAFKVGSTAFETGILVISSTRGLPGSGSQGDAVLPVPSVAVQFADGEPDPDRFVTVGTPEPLSDAALAELVRKIGPDAPRVRAAYRIPVTVAAQSGGRRLDLGPLERTVAVTAAGAVKQIPVVGAVEGLVHLRNGPAVDLGSFRKESGGSTTFVVDADREGLKLDVVEAETVIRKTSGGGRLIVTPEKGSTSREFRFRVTVPPGRVDGEFSDGQIIFDVKGGAYPQRLRIPVKGSAAN